MEDAYPSPSTEAPNNKKYLFIGLFLVVIIMFLATITFIISRFSSAPKNTETAQNSTQNGSSTISSKPSSSTPKVVQSAPQVKFAQWVQPTNPPSALSSSSTYAFKQNYSSQEITALAKSLHADKVIKPDADMSIAYTQNSVNDISALKFNPKTGTFSYINTQGIPISTNSATTIDAKLYSFLQQINWYDSTVKITAHYKKINQPGLVFYELHRDWNSAGLPILNFNGLFNINEDKPLNSLNYTTDNSMPADNNIYATSDHKDGLKRADDFNTITLAISDDNTRLIAINSNLRQLMPTNTKTVPLISYAAALQKLKNNQYTYIFTTPSGSGQISWSKIYPQNKAIADQAVVSEASYAYLEQFPSEVQTNLKPYLLFRGSAALDSGYSVNFIAAVDVTSSTTASAGEVLGAHTYLAQEDPNSHSQGQSQIGVTPIDIPQAPPGEVKDCVPQLTDLNPTIDYTDPSGNTLRLGLGDYVRYTSGKGGESRNEKRWYYIPPADFNSPDKTKADRENTLHAAFNTFTANIAALEQLANPNNDPGQTLYCPLKDNPGHTDKTCKRTWDFLLADFEASDEYFGQTCPLIFSGLSPAIFIYGKEGTAVDVKSWSTLTYADPSTKDSMWHVKIGTNGNLNVNNSTRQYIYYEYAPVTFNRPELGWNIPKTKIATFVNTMSKQLQLTPSETTRLQYEVQNAAKNVNSSTVFIGLIGQQELDSKIPLSVYPTPQSVQRIHFYIGKSTGTSVQAPHIQPVKRNEFMVVELGAVPEK
jgi:hypothetical protein